MTSAITNNNESIRNPMKLKPILIILTLALFAFVLSACAGGSRGTVATSWPGVTADEDTAYLALERQVYAINISNGMEKWRYPAEPDNAVTFFAAPTLTSDGQLLVGGYNNILYSLDPKTGLENWKFSQSGNRFIGSALAREQGIFAPNADNQLYALDSKGNLRWKFPTAGPLWAKPSTDPDCTCIFLSSMDHELYSIDAETGVKNWQTGPMGGSFAGTPTLSADGTLYAGSYANEMLAINSENGKVLWRTPTSDWVWGGPALHDDHLYFGVLDGTFYALNTADGSLVWQKEFAGRITETPLISDGNIYFTTSEGSVNAIDLNGNQIWSKNEVTLQGTVIPFKKLFTAPVAAGDLILIAQSGVDQILVALDTDGNPKWAFVPEKK